MYIIIIDTIFSIIHRCIRKRRNPPPRHHPAPPWHHPAPTQVTPALTQVTCVSAVHGPLDTSRIRTNPGWG